MLKSTKFISAVDLVMLHQLIETIGSLNYVSLANTDAFSLLKIKKLVPPPIPSGMSFVLGSTGGFIFFKIQIFSCKLEFFTR